MKQINFLNRVKTLSSVKEKRKIKSYINEATRSAKSYVNNVNKNLSSMNIKIRDYNEKILREQFENCEVDKNAKDVVCILSKMNLRELELSNQTNLDLNMILNEKEIKKYFEKNLEFLKKKMKIHDNQIVYCVVHRDEDNLHMHTMICMRENNEEMNNKDIEENYDKIIKSTLKKRCSRQLKKFEIDSKNYEEISKIEDKNAFCELFKINDFNEVKQFKKYKDFEKNYIKVNYESQLQKTIQKINKNKTNKKYKYTSNTNNLKNFFENDVHADFVDFITKTEEFDKFKNIAEKIINDKIEVVKTLDKSAYAESKDLKELKERINFRKSNLINKFNSENISEEEYKEMLQLNYKEIEIKRKMQMTLEQYNKEFEKVQEMIINNDFKVEKTQQQKLELLESNLDSFLKQEKIEVKNIFKSKIDVLKDAENVLEKEIENNIKRLQNQKIFLDKQIQENNNKYKNLQNDTKNINEKIHLEKLKNKQLEEKHKNLKDENANLEIEIQKLKNERLDEKEVEEIKNEIKEQKILEYYNQIKNSIEIQNEVNEHLKKIKERDFKRYQLQLQQDIQNTAIFIEDKEIADLEVAEDVLNKAYDSEDEKDNVVFFEILDLKKDYDYFEKENYDNYYLQKCVKDITNNFNILRNIFENVKSFVSNTIKKVINNNKNNKIR